MENSQEKSIWWGSLLDKTTEMAIQTFKILLMLKQDTEAFYHTVRRDFQKRLRITYFADDGTGEMAFQLKWKHWYYIPFYLVFKDRKRILSECSIIIAEEYIFSLTKRNVRKGMMGFDYK